MPNEAQVREVQKLRLRFLNAIWDLEHEGDFPLIEAVVNVAEMQAEKWDTIRGIMEALKADNLIDGLTTAEHGLVRVQLTSEGRRLVESKATGGEPPGGSPASIGNVHVGNNSVVQLSQHSAGSVQQAEITPYDKRAMKQWASDVLNRAHSAGLPDEDLAEVLQEARELQAELDKADAEPAKVRRIGKYVLRILGSAGGSLASSGLVEVGQQLFLN